jgi:hypothetical protein
MTRTPSCLQLFNVHRYVDATVQLLLQIVRMGGAGTRADGDGTNKKPGIPNSCWIGPSIYAFYCSTTGGTGRDWAATLAA